VVETESMKSLMSHCLKIDFQILLEILVVVVDSSYPISVGPSIDGDPHFM
jgi:hypothetical protein